LHRVLTRRWALICLYKGSQGKTLYSRIDGGNLERYAELEVVEERSLKPDDIYYPLYSEGMILAVTTTSGSPSVSIYVLRYLLINVSKKVSEKENVRI
jgi:3-mercaptopropionate dioxygenase